MPVAITVRVQAADRGRLDNRGRRRGRIILRPSATIRCSGRSGAPRASSGSTVLGFFSNLFCMTLIGCWAFELAWESSRSSGGTATARSPTTLIVRHPQDFNTVHPWDDVYLFAFWMLGDDRDRGRLDRRRARGRYVDQPDFLAAGGLGDHPVEDDRVDPPIHFGSATSCCRLLDRRPDLGGTAPGRLARDADPVRRSSSGSRRPWESGAPLRSSSASRAMTLAVVLLAPSSTAAICVLLFRRALEAPAVTGRGHAASLYRGPGLVPDVASLLETSRILDTRAPSGTSRLPRRALIVGTIGATPWRRRRPDLRSAVRAFDEVADRPRRRSGPARKPASRRRPAPAATE